MGRRRSDKNRRRHHLRTFGTFTWEEVAAQYRVKEYKDVVLPVYEFPL